MIAEGTLERFALFVLGIFLIIAFVLLLSYIIVGFFLNKFNKLLYGKSDACAWIPLAQVYLLGKLAFNRTVGWILLGLRIIVNYSGFRVNNSLFISSGMVMLIELVVFTYAVIKYNKIKRGEISKEEAAYQSDQYSFGKTNPISEVNYSNQTPKKYCPSCGSPIIENGAFCQNCGKQL